MISEESHIQEWKTCGSPEQILSGSSSNISEVKRVASAAAKPIAGVYQAQMVINMVFCQKHTAHDIWTRHYLRRRYRSISSSSSAHSAGCKGNGAT